MTKLEGIVRPFQITDVFTSRRLAPVQASLDPVEDVSKTWGDGGLNEYRKFSISGLVGGSTVYKEKSRITETVRVENADDPSQFVEVERIKHLTLASNEGHQIEWDLD